MLFQQQKKTGHAELSPLISLNWRSIRSMISFAKVISQTRKTYGNFRSRIGLVLKKVWVSNIFFSRKRLAVQPFVAHYINT